MSIEFRKRGGFAFWQIAVLLVALGGLAIVLFPVFYRAREFDAHRPNCQSNLKQIGLGFQQYIQDYDERCPIAISGKSPQLPGTKKFAAFGWVDALQPYLKSTQIFQCPDEPTPPGNADPTKPQYTDFWFNAHLSGIGQDKFDAVSLTILNGDGNDGTDVTDARYRLMSIPERWRNDDNSPLYRHMDGCNFAFADSHVKWIGGSRWSSGIDTDNGFTFRMHPLSSR